MESNVQSWNDIIENANDIGLPLTKQKGLIWTNNALFL